MINPPQEPIEQLFSRLSHELRTPITSLQAAIDLLQSYRQCSSADVDALITVAAESTKRLTQVIENILDWYEITHTSRTLFKQPCNVTLLLREVVESLNVFARSKNIRINLESPGHIAVEADPYYLSRSLSYLLHNAIKFSPSDRQVRLILSPCQESSTCTLPQLQIAVQDEGIGIPEFALEAIFRPFYQVDPSDIRCHGGLGLELAICYEIVRQHQGQIWAESELGKGTTIYLLLPMPPDRI